MQGRTRRKRGGGPATRTPAAGAPSVVQLSRWGNGLGLRIPQEIADRLKLKAGARVSVELGADSITISVLRKGRKWTEADLLKGVTPEVVGGEDDWGPPIGGEVW